MTESEWMSRRLLIAAALAGLADVARAQDEPPPPPPPPPPSGARSGSPSYAGGSDSATYSDDEIVNRVSDFLGVTAESAGAVVEKTFKDNGRPTGYIAGEEGSGAFVVGLRYGRGLLYMKNRAAQKLYWQGPSVGFDAGGNLSRVFTLVYGLEYPDAIFRRFPGVEGAAYFIAGIGVNYLRADGITLAPMRAGVGLRLGANVGYLAFSRRRNMIPL